MPTLDRETITRARADPVVFAEILVGEPVWDHQAEVLRSEARVRCVCSGRRAGKTRAVVIASLFEAFVGPARDVLILSAGEEASKQVLAEAARLAMSSSFLAGSVLDESKSQIVLSNGSTIRSVPASEKQVRGRGADLLVLDEAAFISEDMWEASRYTLIDRPGSKAILASTPPWEAGQILATSYRAGVRGEEGFASFHWPSTVSPLVDTELLELWRRTSTEREYRREVLAEWVDDHGAYFSSEELDGAIGDYALVPPEEALGMSAVAGVDWGLSVDANAVSLIALDLDDGWFWLPWLEERFKTRYHLFINRLAEIAVATT